jgi:hypothetical protein
MMACHYSQKTSLENRVGLHYSRFWPFCSSALLENQLLTPLKNLPTRRIREVGLACTSDEARDYRLRLSISKLDWVKLVAELANTSGLPNFKSAVHYAQSLRYKTSEKSLGNMEYGGQQST